MTRVFISTDMEGVAEVAAKSDIRPGNENYDKFTQIQTNEIVAICQLLGKNGLTTVRDAHSEGANVIAERLPENVKLIQHFNGDIWNMLNGLDGTYDMVILHGYHAKGGSEFNPLAHSFSSRKISYLKLNGKLIGEVGFAIYKAAYLGVPVCYVTGDDEAIAEAQNLNRHIIGTETKRFSEKETVILPQKAVLERIKADLSVVLASFEQGREKFKVELPSEFDLRIRYNSAEDGRKYSNFPGAERIDDYEIRYQAKNFEDLLKMMIVCR